MNKPSSIQGRKKRFARWKRTQVDISHFSDVDEASKKDDCEGRAVVLDKDSDVVLEHGTGAHETAKVAHDEHEQRDDD